jgi:hypothetical protein
VNQGVKKIVAAGTQKGKGFLSSGIVGRLHEDVRHTGTRPIGFQEDG